MNIDGNVDGSHYIYMKLPHFNFSTVREMILLLILLLVPVCPAFAGEPKVFTDDDLLDKEVKPMVDQQTLTKREEDLKMWEKERNENLLREKTEREKKKGKEMRQALQKRKQEVAEPTYSSLVNNKSIRGGRPSS